MTTHTHPEWAAIQTFTSPTAIIDFRISISRYSFRRSLIIRGGAWGRNHWWWWWLWPGITGIPAGTTVRVVWCFYEDGGIIKWVCGKVDWLREKDEEALWYMCYNDPE